MRKLVLTCLAAGLFMSPGLAQTLFTFGNHPVSKQEFVRVYQKNSINRKADMSEPALRDYLNLYSLFRMKVQEAELQQLDTLASIQRELDNYRRQLAKNYLTDEQVTNRLLREAYDRMKEEVHVAHILITIPPSLNPADSLTPYRRIDSIYQAITRKKADFAAMARQFSQDPGSKDQGGDIGYMTALQTLYPFENAAYRTPVGKVSAPFRTQLGYHIVKVLDKRPARGEVQVAQILVATPKSLGTEGEKAARMRIDSIRAALRAGARFENMVRQYSEDKFTNELEGVMPPFGVGRMVPAFEDAAFALQKPGDISEPIQTEYGYHILKLVQKVPMKPFDSLQASLKRRIDNDSRSQIARDTYFQGIRERNGFKEYPANLNALIARFRNLPDTGAKANLFSASDFAGMNAPLFDLAGKTYLQSDFVSFAEELTRGRLMGPKDAVVRDIYTMYQGRVVNDFQEHQLVEENEDFRNLMEEYRNGIMLFELMDRNVWGKAARDTAGLTAFYQKNKNKYLWEPGFSGHVYRFKDEAAMKAGMKMLSRKGAKPEDVLKALNTQSTPDAVSVQQGRYEFSRFTDVPRQAIAKGKATEARKNTDGTYTVVIAQEVFTMPVAKTLEEARGYAVAEYQDYLEQAWNEALRRKYPVKVDEQVFQSIVQ